MGVGDKCWERREAGSNGDEGGIDRKWGKQVVGPDYND